MKIKENKGGDEQEEKERDAYSKLPSIKTKGTMEKMILKKGVMR